VEEKITEHSTLGATMVVGKLIKYFYGFFYFLAKIKSHNFLLPLCPQQILFAYPNRQYSCNIPVPVQYRKLYHTGTGYRYLLYQYLSTCTNAKDSVTSHKLYILKKCSILRGMYNEV
jgi:hypothetical protein